jgi:4-methylaminobutanoate oxidase (formaldehyde-forming)
MGVQVHTGVRVTGIELSPRGDVSKVNTTHGSIMTKIVVNAAGEWAPRIGQMVGANIPMTAIMHQYLTTKPIPGHELPIGTPVVRDPDNLVYIREEVQGFLVGGFELEPKAWSVEGVPWEFTQQLLKPEWELFDILMEGAMRRVPIFYVAAGMSLNGIAGAGGVGKIMAEWIIEGYPSIDVHEMNVRRFDSHYVDLHYTAERAREVYKNYYFLHYPNDESEWGRGKRLSALYPRLQELGAVFGEKNGWERVNYFEPGKNWRRAGSEQRHWGWGHPPYFEQLGEEHRAVRERVGLLDMTSFGKIDVRGPGALALLQRLACNNIDKPVGSLTYTQFLNDRGGIESDLTIVRLGKTYFRVVTGTAFAASDLGWIEMYMPEDGSVEVRNVSDDWVVVSMWGPHARDVLQTVTADNVSNEAFPYMTAQAIRVNDVEVWAQRISYVGELGWELYVNPEQAVRVWDILIAAGQKFRIQPVGYKALESLRLEKGYRYWSTDITPDENPFEAGMGFTVRLKSGGDFIGRQALLKTRDDGIRRRLCTLTIDDDTCVIYGGEAVYAYDELVGRVRSGGYGYTVGKNIALSYLGLELAEIGTQVEVEIFGERYPAKVAMDVLYDPKGGRLRS